MHSRSSSATTHPPPGPAALNAASTPTPPCCCAAARGHSAAASPPASDPLRPWNEGVPAAPAAAAAAAAAALPRLLLRLWCSDPTAGCSSSAAESLPVSWPTAAPPLDDVSSPRPAKPPPKPPPPGLLAAAPARETLLAMRVAEGGAAPAAPAACAWLACREGTDDAGCMHPRVRVAPMQPMGAGSVQRTSTESQACWPTLTACAGRAGVDAAGLPLAAAVASLLGSGAANPTGGG